MTILFTILMFIVFGKVLGLAIRAAWGITKILFSVFLLPAAIVGLFLYGFIQLAFVLVIIVGIVTLLGSIFRAV